jgi:AraC-like DNA-binding protein
MKTRLYNQDLTDILFESQYPQFFQTLSSEVVERAYGSNLFFGSGEYKELFFRGFHIAWGNIMLRKPTLIYFESDIETVELHFSLCGHSITHSDNFDQVIEFGCNQHNIFYSKGFKGHCEWGNSKQMEVFEVHLSPDFFCRRLPLEIERFQRFAKAIHKGEQSRLDRHNYPITPQMHQIIREIIHCERPGYFKQIFLEAKILDLLLLQLEQMSQHDCQVFCSLKTSDIDKIQHAHEIIRTELDGNFTLIDLAHRVGTNEFTLKKGFKEIFGNTVFGFWHDLKMEKAKQLLLEESMSVGHVAELIGYKNPQHFTVAFKKKYGVLPSQIK